MRQIAFSFLLCSGLGLAAATTAEQDLITNLPGAENMDFTNMYSGYLDLPGTEKHIFYWYVEAVESPETAPVVFWTNGGPGCSGLLGFLTEQGPFHVADDQSLEKNPYAWNTVANMLFVEQPVGVGFSYSMNSADYTMGDYDAARDNYNAIQEFFVKFPDLLSHDFYISAESYGGHYMPTLAKYIVDNPSNVNFKGFAVGNPYTSFASNTKGAVNTLWGHQLTSNTYYANWQQDCLPFYARMSELEKAGITPEIIKPEKCITDEELILGNVEFALNPYALDYPTCPKSTGHPSAAALQASMRRGGGRFGGNQRMALARHMYAEEPRLLAAIERSLAGSAQSGVVDEYEPCSDDYATTYLNRLDVQQALHVNGAGAGDNSTLVTWVDCSRTINYNSTDGHVPMMPNYEYLLSPENNFGLKIMVYSGDDDMVCATEGSQEWIYTLGFPVIPDRAWHAWHYDDDTYGKQTAGYTVHFDLSTMSGQFVFVTAHGCGHEVPTYKPQLALELFKNYLSGSVYN